MDDANSASVAEYTGMNSPQSIDGTTQNISSRSYLRLCSRLSTAYRCLTDLRAGLRQLEGLQGPEAVADYLVVNPDATRVTFECPPHLNTWQLNEPESDALRTRLGPWAEKIALRIRAYAHANDPRHREATAVESLESRELELMLARSQDTKTVVNLIARRQGPWRIRVAQFIDWLSPDELWALESRRKRLRTDGVDLPEAAQLLGVNSDELTHRVESHQLPVLGRSLSRDTVGIWPWCLDRVALSVAKYPHASELAF